MSRLGGGAFVLVSALACAGISSAQQYQSDFPPEELRARWNGVFDRIGAGAVAVAQGAPLADGFALPRQSNTFYYLTGIETPGAALLLDGRTRRATLYLPPRNERLERSEGKVLSAEDADLVRRLTGVDQVQGRRPRWERPGRPTTRSSTSTPRRPRPRATRRAATS